MLLRNSLAQKPRNQPSCTSFFRPVSISTVDLNIETLSVKDGPSEAVGRDECPVVRGNETGDFSTKPSTGK